MPPAVPKQQAYKWRAPRHPVTDPTSAPLLLQFDPSQLSSDRAFEKFNADLQRDLPKFGYTRTKPREPQLGMVMVPTEDAPKGLYQTLRLSSIVYCSDSKFCIVLQFDGASRMGKKSSESSYLMFIRKFINQRHSGILI